MNFSEIKSISQDTRTISKGGLFIAIAGEKYDGHDFIPEAIKQGAQVIVHEQDIADKQTGITYIQVADSHQALAEIATEFYGHPSSKLKLVGVTGTNGKTTTATLLFQLFRNLGYHCALISTIENRIDDEVFSATLTTPDPIALAEFLKQAVDKGCTHAFMECSSHAIDQRRIGGLHFSGAVFTNLTHDHLDYHGTLDQYAKTKKMLFDTLPETAFALANEDDARGKYMLKDSKAKKNYFTLEDKQFAQSLEGITISWNDKIIRSKLIGRFNAYNLLGLYNVAKLLGEDSDDIIDTILTLKPPLGRLDFIKSPNGVYGVVDYAHTPDALENVLRTLREVAPDNAKIITVVGCGGDRDKTKRPVMGAITFELSDYTVFTSDNPRTEDPHKILSDMIKDLPQDDKYEVEEDREKAISLAVTRAQPGDIVLLAGKGHEDYQIVGNERLHFSDKEELERIFSQ